MIDGIEGALVFGPLEGLGCFYPREDIIDLSREPLDVAVGEGGLSPAEDAGDVALGLLLAPVVLLSRLLVPAAWVWHGSVYLRVKLDGALLRARLLL